MKLQKSSTVLINVALVFLIILLAKSFIGFPKNANATSPLNYKVVSLSAASVESGLNMYTQQGWHFVGTFAWGSDVNLILER